MKKKQRLVCVCVHVRTCVYVCVHVRTCVYVCVHVRTCVYVCVCSCRYPQRTISSCSIVMNVRDTNLPGLITASSARGMLALLVISSLLIFVYLLVCVRGVGLGIHSINLQVYI